MKSLLSICIILFTFLVNSQEELLPWEWKLIGSYKHKNIDAWDINPLSEVLLSSKNSILKLNENFNEEFTQSNKSFGNITSINSSHSLKTLLFSEDNQTIAIVDNSLSFREDIIDLAALDLAYVTHVCYSDQSDRIWVYDEDNSRLICFDGGRKKNSEISNLIGITNSSNLASIHEKNKNLFLFYPGNGIFIFDYYGSLIQKINEKEAKKIFPTEHFLYFLTSTEIIRINLKSWERKKIKLPYSKIEDFRVSNDYIFLMNRNEILKYSIK